MRNVLLILFLVFFLLATSGNVLGGDVYKWVDEKGTLNFSDNPQPEILKSRENKTTKEDGSETVKNLTVGNRELTEDQMKYAPSGGVQETRQDAAPQSTSSSSSKSSTSSSGSRTTGRS